MELDFSLVKHIWYIEKETLVAILQVIKKLDDDLKRKIVSIITWKNKSEEERYEIHYNFSEDVIDDMNTFDYYFSE